jgi:opacity protein-like surface antigen
MKKILALAVIAAACSTTVFAQKTGTLYGEAAYSMVTFKDTSQDGIGTLKPTAGRFTLGTVVMDNVAVEGFMQQGLSDSTKAINANTNVQLEMKSGYGFAVRPFLNLSNETELFGRIGSMRQEAAFKATSISNGTVLANETNKSTNTLYGAGIAYKISDDMKAVVDYTKLNKKDNVDLSIVSIGLRYNFK